jgi:hypothetical protein
MHLFGLWRLVSYFIGLFSLCYELSSLFLQIGRSIVSSSFTTMNKTGAEVFLVISCIIDLAYC